MYSSELPGCQLSSWSWIRKWLLEQYWHASSVKRVASRNRVCPSEDGKSCRAIHFMLNNMVVFTAKYCSPEDHVTYYFSAARCAREVRQQSSKQFQLILLFPGFSFAVQNKEVLCRVNSCSLIQASSDTCSLVQNIANIMWGVIWIHELPLTRSLVKYKFLPNNPLLLFSMLLCYNILFQYVSIPTGIILRDTFKS
jgi:hypothetical protein